MDSKSILGFNEKLEDMQKQISALEKHVNNLESKIPVLDDTTTQELIIYRSNNGELRELTWSDDDTKIKRDKYSRHRRDVIGSVLRSNPETLSDNES